VPARPVLPRTYATGGLQLVADEFVAEPGRGTALLLHGGGQTRHSWRSTGASLARAGWTAISLDSRGHGDSGWAPDGDYSMDALVDDLHQVAATLRQPPVLIGASMGGLTALVAVGEGRVDAAGLVLVDIAPRIEPEGAARVAAFMRAHPDGFASLDDVADAVAAYNPHRARPASPEGLRRNVRLRDGRWYWHWDPAFLRPREQNPGRSLDSSRLTDAARGVAVPTLLVRGQQSEVLSAEGAAELTTLIPAARAVDVGGTGHMVAGDDNDVFTREVLGFLDALPGEAGP
jgi:pimeloyl-ACP methyl ester carboxylesterase